MQPSYNLGKIGAKYEVKLKIHITVTRVPTKPREGEKYRQEGERERMGGGLGRKEFTDPVTEKSGDRPGSGMVWYRGSKMPSDFLCLCPLPSCLAPLLMKLSISLFVPTMIQIGMMAANIQISISSS